MNLFLDIETTGLIRPRTHWKTDYELFPKVLSVAWKINDKMNYYIINLGDHIDRINPDSIRINGITKQQSLNSPHTFEDVMILLTVDLLRAEKVIGHNIYFDTSCIKANVLSLFGLASPQAVMFEKLLAKEKRVDVMWGAQKMTRKFTSQQDLHRILFGMEYGFPHVASNDVNVLERNYNELVKMEYL